jgi:23S rRNA (pseudouridine1915-N3)-methyltransferase
MRVRVIAVGTRPPAWVRSGCEDYLARLASRLAISLVEIEPGARSAGGMAHKAIAAEGQRSYGRPR